jgi:hypothetical protein
MWRVSVLRDTICWIAMQFFILHILLPAVELTSTLSPHKSKRKPHSGAQPRRTRLGTWGPSASSEPAELAENAGGSAVAALRGCKCGRRAWVCKIHAAHRDLRLVTKKIWGQMWPADHDD